MMFLVDMRNAWTELVRTLCTVDCEAGEGRLRTAPGRRLTALVAVASMVCARGPWRPLPSLPLPSTARP